MKVCIVGTGYVGLVSGVCLATKGHDVVCVDKNPDIVDKLNKGIPTIHEDGLSEILKNVVEANSFQATENLKEALDEVNLVIVAVGTPSKNGKIDLSFIKEVSSQIGKYLATSDRFISVVIKSTVIPGTTDSVVLNILEESSGKKLGDFGLGMNPEFLREGAAIDDFLYPDRIVLGHEDEKTLSLINQLYEPWNVEKILVNSRTAELIKYANNALLATQISAINEIANLASSIGGIDVMNVVSGVHLDKRWNPVIDGHRCNPEILKYLIPGCGFGGSCFPKDVQAIRTQGMNLGLKMQVMNAVLDVNDIQSSQVVKILEENVDSLSDKKIMILGLSFKPGTDDVRESSSLKIAHHLLNTGALLTAHDPIAICNFKKALKDTSTKVKFTENWKAEINLTDIIILVTPWDEYYELIKFDLKEKVLFDVRRSFQSNNLDVKTYLGIGLSEKKYNDFY